MELYLVAVVLKPTKKQIDEEGANETLVVQPTPVLARDENHAGMKAYKFVPEEHSNKEDRLEVLVLPFRRTAVR